MHRHGGTADSLIVLCAQGVPGRLPGAEPISSTPPRVQDGMSTLPGGFPLETVRRHFDELGERECDQFVQSPRTLVSLELHRGFLHRQWSPAGENSR